MQQLKSRMEKGKQFLVPGVCCHQASLLMSLRTGIDYIIIDMEHGTMSFETAEQMVRAAELHKCQPIIRVGNSEENTILHALETGSNAIMVPHVASAQVAKRIVQASRYAPLGNRGGYLLTQGVITIHTMILQKVSRRMQKKHLSGC